MDEAMDGYVICVYIADPPDIHLEYINGSPESMLHILYLQRIKIMQNLKSQ